MLNLEDIKDEVVEEGYSELKSDRIDISWRLLTDGLMMYGYLYKRKWAGRIGYFINVHPCLKDVSVTGIRGGIAHECSHIIKYTKHTRKELFRDIRKYYQSQEYCRKEEICTDIETINRGFGYDLLALEIFRERNYNHEVHTIPSSHLKEILARMYDLPVEFTYKDYMNLFENGKGKKKR